MTCGPTIGKLIGSLALAASFVAGMLPSLAAEEPGCGCAFTIGVVETTYWGALDGAARSYLLGEDISTPDGDGDGFDALLDIVLPDGKWPDDMEVLFDPRPGLMAGAGLDVPLRSGMAARVEGFAFRDQTHLLIDAPTGFGILGDPTEMDVTATITGIGLAGEVPVWSTPWAGQSWTVLLGGGALVYNGTTRAKVTSDLLQLDETTSVNRVVPLLQGTLQMEGKALPAKGEIKLRMFPTDKFWAGTLSASAVFPF
jgi:hypothetical protein